MFILHSAWRMTNSVSAPTGWVSCGRLSGACTARGVINDFGGRCLSALKLCDAHVPSEKSLLLWGPGSVKPVNMLLLFHTIYIYKTYI